MSYRSAVGYDPAVARILVDLYSDTQTRPSPGMRMAMAEAEVGDEQRFEDPTTNHLQEMVAELLGKQAAVFLPSGTMCNEIALAVHCRPGEEVFLDRSAHVLTSEAGGPAVIAGAILHPVDGERGVYSAAQLDAALQAQTRHAPTARLVSVENTANMAGGTCWRLDQLEAVCVWAREHGLGTHCDGARLMNAAIATGTPARALAEPFDSVWIDLSKGLGAPVGAVLAGSRDFIDAAWKWKQRLGGSMRQSGVIAAAGVYALEHNVERLAEDHANARALAEGLARLPGADLDPAHVETNIVIFELDGRRNAMTFMDELLEHHGVRLSHAGGNRVRAVTHLDVGRSGIDAALEAIGDVLRS